MVFLDRFWPRCSVIEGEDAFPPNCGELNAKGIASNPVGVGVGVGVGVAIGSVGAGAGAGAVVVVFSVRVISLLETKVFPASSVIVSEMFTLGIF
jgi:hypothetical protein